MSLLRPRPNRRLDRCESSVFSLLHFSPPCLSLSLFFSFTPSFLSSCCLFALSLFHSPCLPSPFSLSLSLSHSMSLSLSLRNISLRISAAGSHGKQCTARRPRKHPLLLSRRGQRAACRFRNLFPAKAPDASNARLSSPRGTRPVTEAGPVRRSANSRRDASVRQLIHLPPDPIASYSNGFPSCSALLRAFVQ